MLVTVAAEDTFDASPELHRITAPTLLVAGGRDRFYTPELFRETAEGIPNARLRLYQDKGQVSVELAIYPWTLQLLQAARGHGGKPAVLALEHGGHHIDRSAVVLGHNEVRLTAPRRPLVHPTPDDATT